MNIWQEYPCRKVDFMKKALAILLVLAMFIPCFGAVSLPTSATASAHVYTIVTNPAENSRNQMNISWHADYTYTNCFVEYTTAGDTAFANAKTCAGTYDDDDYLWFYNRNYGKTGSGYNTTKFLNYGATLTGLTPGTKYIYRINDGEGAYSDTYAFMTAGADNFSILWTSDMHITSYESDKVPRFNATINYLESIAGYDIGLHFNTGDATNCGDRYGFWQTLYGTPVFKKYAYASTVGNHDLYDSMMDDDSNYTQYWKTGKYFGVVNNYPKNSYTSPSSLIEGYLSDDGYSSYASQSADKLIPVTSGALAGKSITGAVEDLNGRHYWFNYGGVLFIVFDYFSMTYNADAEKAFAWAKGVIDANYGKYDYLVASEHLYLYSAGSCTDKKYSKYKAFLDENNVDFFLCGDEHAYVRTGPIYNGSTTSTANKGTVVLQAPAITNTDTITSLSGSTGKIKKRYSKAGYMGACVFDVTPTTLKLKVAISSNGTASGYTTLETVTYNKKDRYREPDSTTYIETGIYTAKTGLTVHETSASSGQVLATIPAGTAFEVNAAKDAWGRVRYNGFTGWVNLTDYTVDYATGAVTAPELFGATAFNKSFADGDTMVVYTPSYGATISNNSWSFTYNRTITAVRDATGAYKVTAQNLDNVAKSNTAIPANGCIILLEETYANYDSIISTLTVGKYITLDQNKACVYTANPGEANVKPVIPGQKEEGLLPKENEGITLGDYVGGSITDITVDAFESKFDNADLRIFNPKGEQVTGTVRVGTGFKVICYHTDGSIIESKEIVVTGDIDSDGMVSSSDCLIMKTVLKSTIVITGPYSIAADYNEDGGVDTTDYAYYKTSLAN